MRQLAILAWKEWREGWTTVVAVWCLAASGVFVAPARPGTAVAPLWGIVVLLGAALLGGRAFAPEAEARTNRFLTAQPVSLDTIWTMRFVSSVLALLVFGAIWYAATPSGFWVNRWFAGDPAALLLPLLSFELAFLLSAAVDNTILACVGGVVGGFGHLLLIGLCQLAIAGAATNESGSDAPAVAIVSVATLLYIVASRYVFRFRARR